MLAFTGLLSFGGAHSGNNASPLEAGVFVIILSATMLFVLFKNRK
jgi:hypothetical protein